MTVLAVSDLTTSFRHMGAWRTVVNAASFEIGENETVAIVGESGSGKSVTALSIMGLLPPRASRVEGSVRLGDRELLGLPDAEMERTRGNEIAMIFQEPMSSLNPVLTIGRQISESLIRHRGMTNTEARAETIRQMERVRIPSATSRFDEFPHQFSGGMVQRIMIAMALACRPKLLIADEPTTALDVTIQAQILTLIRELQREEGMSVMFITHDMGVVAEIADSTVVMFQSEVLETGKTTQIFSAPRHDYTKALLAAVPQLGAMAGRSRPMKFPEPGKADVPEDVPEALAGETADTVAPVLEVRNLTTRFDIRQGLFGRVSGRVHAVENVSFSVAPGTTLALVGESGCGKSTTGRTILRLVDPTSGEILVDGENILGQDKAALLETRKRVQMIFQDPFSSLNPRMRVGDAIAEPIIAHRMGSKAEAGERVASLLSRVGLPPDTSRRFPHELSGGQRQRICIARSLAFNPSLIVADEAVSALDVSIKAQVVNLMLDLQERFGLAYLFISHDMAVVERVSHRVAVMYLGEIVEIGSREAVFGDPQHPYTKRLLSAVPIADPSRRQVAAELMSDEIRTPVRPPDHQPPVRIYNEAGPGHLVQAWDESWA